jgi:hypothetical protein
LRNPTDETLSCRLELVAGTPLDVSLDGPGTTLDGFALDTPFDLPPGTHETLRITVASAASSGPAASGELIELRQWTELPEGRRLEGGVVLHRALVELP